MDRDPARTIAEKFFADFFPRWHPPESLTPLFDDFYAHEYPRLRSLVQAIPAGAPASKTFQRGFQDRLSTMPSFRAPQSSSAWNGAASPICPTR